MNFSQSHDDVLCFKLKSGKVIIVSNLGSQTLVLGFRVKQMLKQENQLSVFY